MQGPEALHAARLAAVESALLALLREAAADLDANSQPDALAVRLDADGIDIEYLRAGFPVAGEGF